MIAAATLYDVIVLQWLPTLRTEELYKYEVHILNYTTLWCAQKSLCESVNSWSVVKMLITLEPHGIFSSIFEYLFILSLSSY